MYKGSLGEEEITIAEDDLIVYKVGETEEIELKLGYIDDIHIVTYDTAVISQTGTISNSASLSGDDVIEGSSGNKTFTVEKSSWGVGTGVSPTRGAIEIVKVDKYEDARTLKGAGFELSYMLNSEEIKVKSDSIDGLFYTDQNGKLELGGLPRGRTYILEEVTPPLGYKLPAEANRRHIIKVEANTIKKETITNERIRDIVVNKIWIGPGKTENGAGTATFELTDNIGTPKKTITLTTETHPDWTYTFEGLDYYDSFGKEIEYTVKEVNLDSNYELLRQEESIDGLGNITYTFNNKSLEIIKIPVEKKWIGDKVKPVIVTIVLDKDISKKLLLNEDNEWKGEFTELLKYDDDGNEIAYTISEEEVNGFVADIAESTIDGHKGFTVTNIELMNIPVTKVWIGDPKVSEVEVELYEKQDGILNKKVADLTLTSDATWEGSFTKIPKYTVGGAEIQYGVKEKPVNGFNTVITGDQ